MTRTLFQGLDLGINGGVAIKQVLVFQQVCFKRHDLLHAHGPLLIPWTGEAQGLVPGRKLNRTCARLFREGHGQHFD